MVHVVTLIGISSTFVTRKKTCILLIFKIYFMNYNMDTI